MPYHRLSLVLAITCSAFAHSQAAVAATPDCADRSTTTDGAILAQASAVTTTGAASAGTTKTEATSPTTTAQSIDAEAKATAASESVPMTTREHALEKAKLGAGRNNPFSPIEASSTDFGFIPSAKTNKPAPSESSPSKTHTLVPPPPPTMGIAPAPPPPPPTEAKASFQLPEPPAKPKLVDHLKLVGILGQQALFVFTDGQLRRFNRWPHNLALSPGEQFESVNLISVDDHLVTLEEDGVRTVRELNQIR